MIAEPGFLAWLMRQVANHLWQSTAFAAAAFLIALALRAAHARTRHWVWLAASIKFLVPFGVLASLGGVIGSWVVPAAPIARIPSTVEQVVQPFALPQEAVPVVAAPAPGGAAFPIAAVLVAIWFIGFAAVLFRWWNRWRHVRAAVRASVPLREGHEADALRRLGSDVELVCSAARLEPGTFGILKPVLWLPAGIADRLSEAELDAIVAHELCHLRRRDNLWAAIHMAAEAIFWFHPLVWWLGARLIEERERACDEEVVRLGSEPHAYAEGVLKVCEFYLESPLPCAAGVTGADLRKRIEGIMASRFIGELCFWKKSLLTALLAAAVACPLLLGVLKPEAQIAAASFEVASVKLADSSDGVPASASTSPRRSGGRFTWTATPTWLVCYAYGLPAWRVLGINGIQPFYGIDATMDSSATADQVRLMLQRLLADRLKLVAHRENRDSKGYALVVVKNGPKIKSAPMYGEPPQMPEYLKGKSASAFEGRIFVSMEGRGISALTGRGVSISQLADTLSETLGASVWDKTGMTGKYYFGFKFLKDAGSSETELPTLFGAVQEELGLKLEPTKGPLEFLLVDHIEKVPTEN